MAFLPVSQTGVVRQMNECLILPYRVRQGLYTILRKNNRTLIKLQKHTLTFPHIVILQFYGKPATQLPSLREQAFVFSRIVILMQHKI